MSNQLSEGYFKDWRGAGDRGGGGGGQSGRGGYNCDFDTCLRRTSLGSHTCNNVVVICLLFIYFILRLHLRKACCLQ